MAALFRQRNNNNPGSLSRPGKAVAGSVTPPRYQGGSGSTVAGLDSAPFRHNVSQIIRAHSRVTTASPLNSSV